MKRSVLVTALVALAALLALPISTANLYAWVGRDVHVAPEYVGKPQSRQCQWTDGRVSGGVSVVVQIALGRCYEPHDGATDFTELHGIGERAYDQNDGGFVAGAIKGGSTIVVSLSGGTANKARAIDALRFFIARL